MLDTENAEELRRAMLHRQKPRQHDKEKQRKAGDRESTHKDFSIATKGGVSPNDQYRQSGRYRTLGQSPDSNQAIEKQKPELFPCLTPGPPAQHRHGEGSGDQHVSGSAPAKADHPRR